MEVLRVLGGGGAEDPRAPGRLRRASGIRAWFACWTRSCTGRQRCGGDGRIRGRCRGGCRGGCRAAKHGGVSMPRVRAAESFAVRRVPPRAFAACRSDRRENSRDRFSARWTISVRTGWALRPETGERPALQHGQIRGEAHRFWSSCWAGETSDFTYVQSRFYRAAEVILGLPYGCPADVWSLVHHGRTAQRKPLFSGKDEREQLRKITEALGEVPREMVERCAPERRAAHLVPARARVRRETARPRFESPPLDHRRRRPRV